MPSPTARVQRVLPAPPGVVYDEWLDPDALTEWMCPRPARCLRVEMEPWTGGSLRLDIEDGGTEFSVVGQFTVLDRPRRLSFPWHCSTWPDPDAESIVIVSFKPRGTQETLMTIEHILLPGELVEQHQRGWEAIAEQFDAALKRSAQAPTRDSGGDRPGRR
jgi:uncharacterized protein YndB with AHSA1/START domain